MADGISSISQTRSGGSITVIAIPSLSAPVYFFWWLDGVYMGTGSSSRRTFVLADGDQARVDVIASNDPNFDPIASGPALYPAKLSLFFVRSLDTDIQRYRIEQKIGGGAYTAIGYLNHDPRKWNYTFVTGRLLDLTNYTFRVIPIDSANNDGTPVVVAQEQIVRTPDAPNFTATLNGSQHMVFAAA